MAETMLPNLRMLRQYWTHTVKSMMLSQLWMLKTGLEAAQTVLTPVATMPADTAAPPASVPGTCQAGDIIHRAMDRMKKGLAPPREVYQAPYRNLIDWSRFPDWARPIDPEMFEGSGHEG